MENPMGWGPVEKTIHEARLMWEHGRERQMVGFSMEMQIANALRDAGLVHDPSKRTALVHKDFLDATIKKFEARETALRERMLSLADTWDPPNEPGVIGWIGNPYADALRRLARDGSV